VLSDLFVACGLESVVADVRGVVRGGREAFRDER
jgi:hypothetical protein